MELHGSERHKAKKTVKKQQNVGFPDKRIMNQPQPGKRQTCKAYYIKLTFQDNSMQRLVYL